MAVHPLRGGAPEQKRCIAYGSGAVPQHTRTNAELARRTTHCRTPPCATGPYWWQDGHAAHAAHAAHATTCTPAHSNTSHTLKCEEPGKPLMRRIGVMSSGAIDAGWCHRPQGWRHRPQGRQDRPDKWIPGPLHAQVNPTGGSPGGPPTLPPIGPSCAWRGYHYQSRGPRAHSQTGGCLGPFTAQVNPTGGSPGGPPTLPPIGPSCTGTSMRGGS